MSKPVRFQKIRTKIKEKSDQLGYQVDIVREFLEIDNISILAESYDEPYSNFRRFILLAVKERGADFLVDYVNTADFDYLRVGDTFQYADHLTIWKVIKVMKKESEEVFKMLSTKQKTLGRHWICDELEPEYAPF